MGWGSSKNISDSETIRGEVRKILFVTSKAKSIRRLAGGNSTGGAAVKELIPQNPDYLTNLLDGLVGFC